MTASCKKIYVFLCVSLLFLIPFVHADENIEVSFYKDGMPAETVTAGNTYTLHAELVTANASDYIEFSLADDKLKFTDNEDLKTLNVYGRNNGSVWVYETQVEVLEDNPQTPTALIVRDTTVPDLSSAEKPTELSINLNSEQIVSPGDVLEAYAVLSPVETVNSTYYNYIHWSVSYDDTLLTLDRDIGESITITVPEEAANSTLHISAFLDGNSSGVGEDLACEEKILQVEDTSLSVQIFPSTDSEGIILGDFIGFSSEILRNGKVAIPEISESSEYTWTAKLGEQYINGNKDNRTNFTVSPEQVGTLSVTLTVTLENGVTLESQTVTKTVVEAEQNLEAIELQQVENGTALTGSEVEVTRTLSPAYPTNLDSATYRWTAKQGEKVIAESREAGNFKFTPTEADVYTVELDITAGENTVKSEPISILVQDSEETPEPAVIQTGVEESSTESGETKIISGDVRVERSKTGPLITGETIIFHGSLATQGNEDNIEYSWKAVDEDNNVLKESQQEKDFSFTSEKPGEVKFEFVAQVKDDTSNIEETNKKLTITKTLTFTNNTIFTQDLADTKSRSKEDTNAVKEISSNQTSTGSTKITDNTKDSPNKENTSTSVEKNNNEDLQEEAQILQVSDSQEEKLTQESSKETTATNEIDQVETPKNTKYYLPGETVNSITEDTKYNTNTSSKNTTVPIKSSSVKSVSVLNQSSNIENPKTGYDFTIGQIGVLFTCGNLILISVFVLIRKLVSRL